MKSLAKVQGSIKRSCEKRKVFTIKTKLLFLQIGITMDTNYFLLLRLASWIPSQDSYQYHSYYFLVGQLHLLHVKSRQPHTLIWIINHLEYIAIYYVSRSNIELYTKSNASSTGLSFPQPGEFDYCWFSWLEQIQWFTTVLCLQICKRLG